MSSEFQELYGVNSEDSFRFFFGSLLQVLRNKKRSFEEDELFYVADILTRHSLEPINEFGSNGGLKNGLLDILDCFILGGYPLNDPQILEEGGSRVVLFAGFFRDQMARRHNLNFYDRVGQDLYYRVSVNSSDHKRRIFFGKFAATLPMWTRTCSDLSRYCRHQRHMLNIN